MHTYRAGALLMQVNTPVGNVMVPIHNGNRIEAMSDEQVTELFEGYCSRGFRDYFAFYAGLSQSERLSFDDRVNAGVGKQEHPVKRRVLSFIELVCDGRFLDAWKYLGCHMRVH